MGNASDTHGCPRRYPSPVEQFYTALLVATALLSAWFAYYVVRRLLAGDR